MVANIWLPVGCLLIVIRQSLPTQSKVVLGKKRSQAEISSGTRYIQAKIIVGTKCFLDENLAGTRRAIGL